MHHDNVQTNIDMFKCLKSLVFDEYIYFFFTFPVILPVKKFGLSTIHA